MIKDNKGMERLKETELQKETESEKNTEQNIKINTETADNEEDWNIKIRRGHRRKKE